MQAIEMPQLDELVENNPGVDEQQVRDAQKLMDGLRRDGVDGPSYGIVSPYERRAFPH
jgi:hypothetical protein